MDKIKAILDCCLDKLRLTTKDTAPDVKESPIERPTYAGPQIITNADAVFLHHNDNVVLVVDHEFKDVPSWVEWDTGQKKLAVAQMGGTITELATSIKDEDLAAYKARKKIHLVANYGGEKIIHQLSFILRD